MLPMLGSTKDARAQALLLRNAGKHREALRILRLAWRKETHPASRALIALDAAFSHLAMENFTKAMELIQGIDGVSGVDAKTKEAAINFVSHLRARQRRATYIDKMGSGEDLAEIPNKFTSVSKANKNRHIRSNSQWRRDVGL